MKVRQKKPLIVGLDDLIEERISKELIQAIEEIQLCEDDNRPIKITVEEFIELIDSRKSFVVDTKGNRIVCKIQISFYKRRFVTFISTVTAIITVIAWFIKTVFK